MHSRCNSWLESVCPVFQACVELALGYFRKDDSYNIVATCLLRHECLEAEAGLGFEVFRNDHVHNLSAL